MSHFRKSSHSVHDLKVHLVWITKYRYHVLNTEIGTRVRDIIRQTCQQMDIQIIKGVVSRNHIHLYISYPPKLSISEIMKTLKGRSSRKLQLEFPKLGKRYWGKHFWGIGYGAFSSGNVTDEMIKNYIENHGKSEAGADDFIVE